MLRLAAPLLFLALAAFAHRTAAGQANDPTTIHISAGAFQREQAILTVLAGTTITFVNDDVVAHEIAADRDKAQTTGRIEPGQSGTITVTRTEKFGCVIHGFDVTNSLAERMVVQVLDEPTPAPVEQVLLKFQGLTAERDAIVFYAVVAPAGTFVAATAGTADGGYTFVGSRAVVPEDQTAPAPLTFSSRVPADQAVFVGLYRDSDGNGSFDGHVDTPLVHLQAGNPEIGGQMLFPVGDAPEVTGDDDDDPYDAPSGGIRIPASGDDGYGGGGTAALVTGADSPGAGGESGSPWWPWIGAGVLAVMVAGGAGWLVHRNRTRQ